MNNPSSEWKEKHFLSGPIAWHDYSEGEAIHIGEQPLARWLENWNGQQVWCCYVFSNKPITLRGMLDIAILSAEGLVDAELSSAWSEITGFLWVNEDGEIGGHNLITIFTDHVGQFGAVILQTEPIDLGELVEQYGEKAIADLIKDARAMAGELYPGRLIVAGTGAASMLNALCDEIERLQAASIPIRPTVPTPTNKQSDPPTWPSAWRRNES
jgi:hypothetical protein